MAATLWTAAARRRFPFALRFTTRHRTRRSSILSSVAVPRRCGSDAVEAPSSFHRAIIILCLVLSNLFRCEFSYAADKPSFKDRPNILWLVSEDNDRLLGCYGDSLARTPTLDKLAREGVLYERCFAQPVCAPSRFTLITGMYAVSHGPAQHMRAQGKIPSWLKGFPTLL